MSAISIKTTCRIVLSVGLFSTMVAGFAQQTAASQKRPVQLAGMRVWLAKSLDTRKIKQGDPVTARPQAKVRMANGVEFLPSTVLVGHVDAVQPSQSKSDATISLTFDKAQMKDGRSVSIKATILWIAPSPDLMNPSVTSSPADRSTPGAGVGAGQSVSAPPSSTPYSAVQPPSPRDDSRTMSALDNDGPATGSFRQQNGVPGVSLESDIGASYSGIFRATHQNVSLPEGTVMALAIVVIQN